MLSFNYAGASYFYNFNGHGDIIGLTDANGNQVAGYDYDAYGNIAAFSGDIGLAKANPYRYAGYRYDDETDLYYLINRYYDPNAGRFITKDTVKADPMQPITQNLYVYTGNNPVNFTDPDGHFFKQLLKKAAGIFFGTQNNYGIFNSINPGTIAKVSNTIFSVINSIAPSKTKRFSVGSKKVNVTTYGNGRMKATSRGSKPSLLSRFTSSLKLNRTQTKAVKDIYNYFNKNKITPQNLPKAIFNVTVVKRVAMLHGAAEFVGENLKGLWKLSPNYQMYKFCSNPIGYAQANVATHIAIYQSFKDGSWKSKTKSFLWNEFPAKWGRAAKGIVTVYANPLATYDETKNWTKDAISTGLDFSVVGGAVSKGVKFARVGENVVETTGNLDKIMSILKNSKPVNNRLEYTLEDGSKVIFRKDFGENAHPIGNKYPYPVDHYNIEIHKRYRGRYKKTNDFHIIVDKKGKVIEIKE